MQEIWRNSDKTKVICNRDCDDSLLPRDAMLTRYMLWPCVRPFVCLSVARLHSITAAKNATQKPRGSSFVICSIPCVFNHFPLPINVSLLPLSDSFHPISLRLDDLQL